MTETHCGKTIEIKPYRYEGSSYDCWAMYLDGEFIGTSQTKRRALDFAKATAALRLHEEIHGKPTEDEIFGRL